VTLEDADTRFQALQPFFTGRRTVNLRGALAEEYVQHRLKTGVVTATINRELATFIRHPIGYTGSGARENYGASNARVSDRYNIVSPADLQDTAQMCDGHSGHNAPPRLTLPS
jgi:hypothetical protein